MIDNKRLRAVEELWPTKLPDESWRMASWTTVANGPGLWNYSRAWAWSVHLRENKWLVWDRRLLSYLETSSLEEAYVIYHQRYLDD